MCNTHCVCVWQENVPNNFGMCSIQVSQNSIKVFIINILNISLRWRCVKTRSRYKFCWRLFWVEPDCSIRYDCQKKNSNILRRTIKTNVHTKFMLKLTFYHLTKRLCWFNLCGKQTKPKSADGAVEIDMLPIYIVHVPILNLLNTWPVLHSM